MMSGAVKILPHYTYEDYLQWEGRWELIDGIPYAMSPSPIPKHQIIAGNVLSEFRFALKSCKHCKVMQPVDYKVKEDTIYQPDMLIVCKPIEKKFLDFPPSLVVEILSPSSVMIDRHTKYYAYKEQQIPYYLMIAPDTEEIEIYVLEGGEYIMKLKGTDIQFNFQFDEGCEATIDFSEIWK